MSAPDTNLTTQKRNHRGPLWGIVTTASLALLLLIAFVVWTVDQGNTPGTSEAEIDATTGAVVDTGL